MRLPDDFLLGAATAAYQVEGAAREDGRGPSIWDTFSHAPGRTFQGHTGDVACDHYHLWPRDVALMKDLGLPAYRLSLAWPRIVPGGTGSPNPAGLDFYDRLVDGLLEAGVEPWVTLYHWDLPQPLEDRGGWTARETALAFGDYAAVAVGRLGDRVRHWFTLNEPWCSAVLGYERGEHAPGRREPARVVNQAIHHLLLAHGLGVGAVRAAGAGEVGIVHVPLVPVPLTPEDEEACESCWQEHTGWWFEPLFGGRYPEDEWRRRGGDVPAVRPGDMDLIAAPTDFVGLNVYFPMVVRKSGETYEDVTDSVDLPRTDMGWPVYPPVLSRAVLEVHRRYRPGSLYITENGCATPDAPGPDRRVHDWFRREYLRSHLAEALHARAEGAPLRGYFAWSLLDNFEWAYGYSKRFGLVYVDYSTQERIPKASAEWYARLIRERRLEP